VNLSFQFEGWTAVADDIRDLCKIQYAEIALFRELTPLDPDWQLYFEWAKARRLKVFTVRDSGKLVGWHLSLVGPHPHYKTTLFGMQDLYYVLPEYRAMPTIGLRLFGEMEDGMRQLGVKRLIGNTKVHVDKSPLFEHLGWQKTGLIYEKVLA
jgi:hypothetical protein